MCSTCSLIRGQPLLITASSLTIISYKWETLYILHKDFPHWTLNSKYKTLDRSRDSSSSSPLFVGRVNKNSQMRNSVTNQATYLNYQPFWFPPLLFCPYLPPCMAFDFIFFQIFSFFCRKLRPCLVYLCIMGWDSDGGNQGESCMTLSCSPE